MLHFDHKPVANRDCLLVQAEHVVFSFLFKAICTENSSLPWFITTLWKCWEWSETVKLRGFKRCGILWCVSTRFADESTVESFKWHLFLLTDQKCTAWTSKYLSSHKSNLLKHKMSPLLHWSQCLSTRGVAQTFSQRSKKTNKFLTDGRV